jgi:hypothetical protein
MCTTTKTRGGPPLADAAAATVVATWLIHFWKVRFPISNLSCEMLCLRRIRCLDNTRRCHSLTSLLLELLLSRPCRALDPRLITPTWHATMLGLPSPRPIPLSRSPSPGNDTACRHTSLRYEIAKQICVTSRQDVTPLAYIVDTR